MGLTQLIRVRDQKTIPLRKKRVIFFLKTGRSLVTVQDSEKAIKGLITSGLTIKRDEMGVHSGRRGLYHIRVDSRNNCLFQINGGVRQLRLLHDPAVKVLFYQIMPLPPKPNVNPIIFIPQKCYARIRSGYSMVPSWTKRVNSLTSH